MLLFRYCFCAKGAPGGLDLYIGLPAVEACLNTFVYVVYIVYRGVQRDLTAVGRALSLVKEKFLIATNQRMGVFLVLTE